MGGMRAAAAVLAVACGSAAAEWQVDGELRARYESLDGQFRRGFEGSDQAIFTRALFKAEYDFGRLAIAGEMQDSRAFVDDEGTPLSGSFVNTADVLQAYVAVKSGGFLGAGSTGRTTLGRQTISIGSKRQVERVSYANVIRTFTGLYHLSENARGDELHMFAAVPVARLTEGAEGARKNEFEADEEEWSRKFFGIHYRRADAFPAIASDITAELFAYGLFEDDAEDFEGPNRQYVYPGFRLYRPKRLSHWDLDLEPSVRFGTRRATSAPGDETELDVFATRVIAIAGYTFDLPWQPRLAAEWFWASGDEDPSDDNFERYERLFGSRRTDLNNTSLHGPLTYSNLDAPGARLEVKPNDVTDARVAWSVAHLASETDQFQIARLQDPTGESGSFMGHTIDVRTRYLPKRQPIVYEAGGSVFLFGEFTENVPDRPDGSRTLFGYIQATLTF